MLNGRQSLVAATATKKQLQQPRDSIHAGSGPKEAAPQKPHVTSASSARLLLRCTPLPVHQRIHACSIWFTAPNKPRGGVVCFVVSVTPAPQQYMSACSAPTASHGDSLETPSNPAALLSGGHRPPQQMACCCCATAGPLAPAFCHRRRFQTPQQGRRPLRQPCTAPGLKGWGNTQARPPNMLDRMRINSAGHVLALMLGGE